eukprot:1160061-Pelagomonas_calceolata.AAC.2
MTCIHTWVGLLLGHAQQVDGGKQWGVEGHGWVPQHDVVHYVLIDLGVAVQLVGGDAVKQALCFPGHAWNAVHRPPHLDGLSVVGGLPHALHLHVQLAEEELAVEAQGPKDDAVILEALKLVAGIPEHDVFTVDVICEADSTGLRCQDNGLFSVLGNPDAQPHTTGHERCSRKHS